MEGWLGGSARETKGYHFTRIGISVLGVCGGAGSGFLGAVENHGHLGRREDKPIYQDRDLGFQGFGGLAWRGCRRKVFAGEGSGPGSGIGVFGETGWAVGVAAWPWRNTLQGIWGLAIPGRGGFVVWVRVSWGKGHHGSRLR